MIKIEGFSYWYPEATTAALKSISTVFNDGEVVLLTGSNGGGKSTLLKSLISVTNHIPGSRESGLIVFNNIPITNLQTYELAGQIGIVFQDPETQVSNLTVWDEVTFGPANLCWSKDRVIQSSTKALDLLQLSPLRNHSVFTLSGGQLQRLSIASLLSMHSEVVFFDEPVTNLDPNGVDAVVGAIARLRNHTKLIIISSHWLDPFLDLATRLIIMDQGQIVWDKDLDKSKHRTDILEQYGVRTPERWKLETIIQNFEYDWQPKPWVMPLRRPTRSLMRLDNLTFRYHKNHMKILENVNLTIDRGERIAIVGHNGQGKTTLARLIAGLLHATEGRVIGNTPKTSVVLQRPSLGFLYNSVSEELDNRSDLIERFEFEKYRNHSPHLLSGGEQRRLALAIALKNDPELILLDESTAELDSRQVRKFLSHLENIDASIIHITHDPRIVGNCVEKVIMLGGHTVRFTGTPDFLTKEILIELGYDKINPTVRLLIDKQLNIGIPLLPDQLEVENAGLHGRKDILPSN